jgi:hypothetical protein
VGEVGDRRRGGLVCWCIVVFVFCVESDEMVLILCFALL